MKILRVEGIRRDVHPLSIQTGPLLQPDRPYPFRHQQMATPPAYCPNSSFPVSNSLSLLPTCHFAPIFYIFASQKVK